MGFSRGDALKPVQVPALTKYWHLDASSRMRTLQYLHCLEQHGLSVTVQALLDDDQLQSRYQRGGCIVSMLACASRWDRLVSGVIWLRSKIARKSLKIDHLKSIGWNERLESKNKNYSIVSRSPGQGWQRFSWRRSMPERLVCDTTWLIDCGGMITGYRTEKIARRGVPMDAASLNDFRNVAVFPS